MPTAPAEPQAGREALQDYAPLRFFGSCVLNSEIYYANTID
jgi:hypothetical protein